MYKRQDVNDKPSAQFFSSSDAAAGSEEVAEEAGSYTVTVKLDKVSEKTVTIPYTIDFSSNTAIIASDNSDATSTVYPSDWVKWDATDGSTALTFSVAGDGTQTGTGTLTISGAAADATALQSETFLVTINDDAIDENTESIYFTMDTPTNASKGTENTFRLDITDPADSPVRYSFATSNTGNAPATSGTEDATPSFRIYLLDPADQTQAKESGKTVTINWTMDLTGGDDDNSEANDFTLPNDFGTGTTSSGTFTFSPRTSSAANAETYKEITTSEIAINGSDVTYETTESFSIALSTADATAAADPDHASTSILHKYSITNKDDPPVIDLTSATKNIYENSNDGAVSHDFEFKIADTSPIQKSELDINAYFKIASTSSGDDVDADILDADGVYAAGDLDYTYDGGALSNNQVVTISGSAASPITSASSGTITISSYDDALDELEETFELQMYTYNDAQATTASLATGASNATAPDGSKTDDTGYDVSTVTILKDDSDRPNVQFSQGESATLVTSLSVDENTSDDPNLTITVRLSGLSQNDIVIPYTIDTDASTAQIHASDTDYPNDYLWLDKGSASGQDFDGTTGKIYISQGNQYGTIKLSVNDDDIDEADETIEIALSDPENSYATLGLKSTMTITITDNDCLLYTSPSPRD